MNPAKTAQQLVVVLGMHRSGTSAITRSLQTMGVVLGDRLEPAAEGINDKGYWEDIDLVTLNVEMLRHCGRDWDSLEPLQQVDIESLCNRGYISRAAELLRIKLSGHARFGFKDPRTAKMLPFWNRVFEIGRFNVRYILALRNPLSVVRSLTRRDCFDPEKSYFLWVDHIISILSYAGEEALIIVDYDQLMEDPDGELHRVAAWLDAELNAKELAVYRSEFLENRLRHSKFDPADAYADVAVPMIAREIYGFLVNAALEGRGSIDWIVSSGQIKKWKDELERLRPALRLCDKQHHKFAVADQKLAEVEELAEQRMHVISGLHESLEQMRNSMSWRITAPMRYVAIKARGTHRMFYRMFGAGTPPEG